MSAASSCQPHHHVNHIFMKLVGTCERWKRVNSRLKSLENILGRKTQFWRVEWPSVVAAGGSLFPPVRASIRESGRQYVHETEARARFHIKFVKKTDRFGALLAMHSLKLIHVKSFILFIQVNSFVSIQSF